MGLKLYATTAPEAVWAATDSCWQSWSSGPGPLEEEKLRAFVLVLRLEVTALLFKKNK